MGYPYLEAGGALAQERRRQREARCAVSARLTEKEEGGSTHIGAIANEIFLLFLSQASLDIDFAIPATYRVTHLVGSNLPST